MLHLIYPHLLSSTPPQGFQSSIPLFIQSFFLPFHPFTSDPPIPHSSSPPFLDVSTPLYSSFMLFIQTSISLLHFSSIPLFYLMPKSPFTSFSSAPSFIHSYTHPSHHPSTFHSFISSHLHISNPPFIQFLHLLSLTSNFPLLYTSIFKFFISPLIFPSSLPPVLLSSSPSQMRPRCRMTHLNRKQQCVVLGHFELLNNSNHQ